MASALTGLWPSFWRSDPRVRGSNPLGGASSLGVRLRASKALEVALTGASKKLAESIPGPRRRWRAVYAVCVRRDEQGDRQRRFAKTRIQRFITRDVDRLAEHRGRFRFTLDGNSWRGPLGPLELHGRDAPTYARSPTPFSATLTGVRVAVPVRDRLSRSSRCPSARSRWRWRRASRRAWRRTWRGPLRPARRRCSRTARR